MAEMNAGTNKTGRIRRRFKGSHRGRGAQVFIYLGKLLRMFIYQSDWKVLPMAALIAGLTEKIEGLSDNGESGGEEDLAEIRTMMGTLTEQVKNVADTLTRLSEEA